MKRSTIKGIAVLLILCSCIGLAACGTTKAADNSQGTVTATAATQSINYVNSLADLMKAQPGIIMNDAPAGSTNVTYGWINNIPVIAQITFTYNGINYTYRAVTCPGGVASTDISNITTDFKGVTSVNLMTDNEAGGTYVLRYNPDTGEGVANWTSTLSKCQYSLHSPNGCVGDVQTMPMTQVMQKIYLAVAETKVATGNTVLAAVNGAMTITTSAGASAVIDCSNIPSLKVSPNDVIDLVYTGDLAGNAYAIKITKVGTAPTTTANTVNGTVYQVDSSKLYLLTADQNVYILTLTSNTKITGTTNALAANQEVKVSYSGNLNTGATADTVEILKQGSTPTVKPSQTTYSEKSVSGTVTSVAGNYVTVQGILFTVNRNNCYVSGYAQVGSYATINYRDYGYGKYEVTSAYFGNVTPTPTSYTDRTCCGTITYANGIYIGVEGGYDFTVNSANCYVSGTAEKGGYARIDYRDYGYGKYEVTAAYFTPADKSSDYEMLTAYGTVDSYGYGEVSVGGVSYQVTSDTYVTGTAEQRGTATVWYNSYRDGRRVATQIEFYPATNPESDYEILSSYGTVDAPPTDTVTIGGVTYQIAYDTAMSGTPEQRGTASIWYRQYSDGRKVASTIEFHPATIGDDTILDDPYYEQYINQGQGDLIDPSFAADYVEGQGDLIDESFAVGY